MAEKSLIYCEVTCRKCGDMALKSGNYSPERIKALQEETKNWTRDAIYEVLCPKCK